MISLAAAFAVSAFSGLSVVLWYSLYSYLIRTYHFEAEFTSRLVAGLHALIAIVFSLVCMIQGPDALESPGGRNTWMQVVTMLVSLGYFAYDLWWCVVHQPEMKVMLLHHIVSLTALAFILLYGKSGSEATAGLFSLEFTNPFLQARWFLREKGRQGTLIFTTVEVLFMMLFLGLRLGYGSKLTVAVVYSPTVCQAVKIVTILLFIISLVFIINIGLFVFRKYISKSRTMNCDYTCEDDCPHREEDPTDKPD